jgi:phosphoglycolate phosphatase
MRDSDVAHIRRPFDDQLLQRLLHRAISACIDRATHANFGVLPTVLLFDIDGTLITTGGIGRRAIERAFHARFGSSDALAFSFGGMTDRAIVRDALAVVDPELRGRELDAEIDRVIALYLDALSEETRAAPALRVHRGIRQAIDRARGRTRCAIGLGTGNVRRGAELKLTPVGLYDLFSFGGFGCDHIDRAEILRIGARRGAEQLGLPPAECRVVVIGDTPKDVRAAQAIGAECIAVATGGISRHELAAANPDHVFSHLAEEGALDALLP